VPLDIIPVYLKEGAIVPVQLNRSLRFGESMTNNKVGALIVTLPATGEKKMNTINSQNAEATVMVKSSADAVHISLDNYSEMFCLLVYGERNIAGVKVNGEVLPELKVDKMESLPPGWYPDKETNRLVIRLPHGKARKIEIKL
jgi:ribosomal protein S6E (S10)